MGKKKSLLAYQTPASSRNINAYWHYYNMLKEYAINMFEWINLPDTVDSRYIELMLFDVGYVCFFEDSSLNNNLLLPNLKDMKRVYLCLQCTLGGRFNVYNLPTYYQIVTPTGYTAKRDKSNSVVIYNNYLHRPTFEIVEFYAYRLYEIQRTIDVNLVGLRHPVLFTTSEEQLLTFKNLWKQVDNFEPFVLVNDDFNTEGLQAIQTGVSNNTIELQNLKHQIMNEALTLFGINNANTDKKERLVTDEVNANNEQLLMSRQVMLNARKQACKEINRMFGLNIDVRFRNEVTDIESNKEPIQIKESEEE